MCAAVLGVSASASWAADKAVPTKKLTCCQKAAAEGKTCSNNCCVTAHRKKQSCTRCNPNKEDLALLEKKQATSAKKSPTK